MPDEHVAQHRPVLRREQDHQILFDLGRIAVFGKSKAIGQPDHMRVDNDAGVDAMCIPQDHVRSFAGNPPKSQQFFHCPRDLAAEALGNSRHGCMN